MNNNPENTVVTAIQTESPSSLVTLATYKSFIRMIEKIKNCDSWCGKMEPHSGFSKELKEALNVLIFACLKDIMLPEDTDLSAFPAFIFKRLYRKAYTWDAKPENTQYLRGKVPHLDALLEQHAYKKLTEERFDGEDVKKFADFIWAEAAKFPKEAERVFRAAKVIGTLIEYEVMADKLRIDTKEDTRQRVFSDLKKYNDLPHFTEIVEGLGEYGELKELFKIISEGARNRHRWQMFYDRKNCFSIMAHMLETALIGYLANLEMSRDTDILKDFWVLLFHDIAEIWTDDIPSPVKDEVYILKDFLVIGENISPESVIQAMKEAGTLRKLAEEMECEALERHFYPKLLEPCVKFFREGVMLEDITVGEDASEEEKRKVNEMRRFYKSADYFSADIEVYLNIKGGSHNKAYYDILERSVQPGSNRTHAELRWLEGIVKKCQGIVFFD